MKPGDVFVVSDQGDGWWHCPSPLTCRVVDGPSPRTDEPDSTYVLVETDPPIEWHGDDSVARRWGPDHPACHAIAPTRFLLLLSSHTPHGFTLDLDGDGGVPAYPVVAEPRTVSDAEVLLGIGAKVSVGRLSDD